MMYYQLLSSSILLLLVATIASPTPANKDEYEDGFWFGMQNLACVMNNGELKKVKRFAPRFEATRAHSLVFYKDLVFEWGTGTKGYYFGPRAAVSRCRVTWDSQPAGFSECDVGFAQNFTRRYHANFGGYSLITNNCHHFLNRLASLLSSPSCDVTPDDGRLHRLGSVLQMFVRRLISLIRETTTADESDDQVPVIQRN